MKTLCLLAALGVTLAACNNDCQNLANNICECAPNQTAQQNCQMAASLANGTYSLSSDDLSRCTQWLQTCDCRMLASGSYQAKVACGLARPNPGGKSIDPSGR